MHRLSRLSAALLVSFFVRLCSADATGMVPGDVVLSNVSNFPGHAGIYIGRWSMLPQNLREAHTKAFAEAAVRSGSPEILDSYLVVDSMPSRGARISPMVEQFSDYHGGTNAYYPNLSKFDLAGALRFEADKGIDVRWPTLSDTDLRRWKIVETALELAENHVGYDDAHMQFATTWIGEAARSLAGGTLRLDCISFCHYVYWQAAEIDLDVSWAPFHTPEQLYDYAKKELLWRPVSFKPLLWDAAYLGLWKVKDNSFTSKGMSQLEADAAQETVCPSSDSRYEVRRAGADFTFDIYEQQSGKRIGDPVAVKLDKLAMSPIQAGSAAGSLHGGELTVCFYPLSSEQAMMTTSVEHGGKAMKITTILERERRIIKLMR